MCKGKMSYMSFGTCALASQLKRKTAWNCKSLKSSSSGRFWSPDTHTHMDGKVIFHKVSSQIDHFSTTCSACLTTRRSLKRKTSRWCTPVLWGLLGSGTSLSWQQHTSRRWGRDSTCWFWDNSMHIHKIKNSKWQCIKMYVCCFIWEQN